MPSAWAAMPMRPPFSVVNATPRPRPRSPSRASLGTTQSSNTNSAVEEQRIPSFFSSLPMRRPGVGFSTIKALRRRLGASGSVTAMSTMTPASWPLVTKIFVPVMCQRSSLSSARHVAAPASLPLPGSVSDRHPISSPPARRGRYVVFCSVVPKVMIGSTHKD